MKVNKKNILFTLTGFILINLCFFLYYSYSQALEEQENYKEALILSELSNGQKNLRNLVVFTEKMIESDAYLSENQIEVVKELGNPLESSIQKATMNIFDTEIKSYFENYNSVYKQIYHHVITTATNNNKEQIIN